MTETDWTHCARCSSIIPVGKTLCGPCISDAGADVRALPGHPTKAGAGYDCNCGACLSLPARKAETDG